jgi:hypothetical protein
MPPTKSKAPMPLLKGKKTKEKGTPSVKTVKINKTPLTIPPQHYNK